MPELRGASVSDGTQRRGESEERHRRPDVAGGRAVTGGRAVAGDRDVLGHRGDSSSGPVAALGRFLARDGSVGCPVGLDLDRPHVVSVVGKRGSGKSHTLGVLAEELASERGVTGVVVDTMGVFRGLRAADARVVDSPTVPPVSIPAELWPAVVGLGPTSPAGSLVWRAAETDEAPAIAAMRRTIRNSSAERAVVRTADAHLALAESWGCFAEGGLQAPDLFEDRLLVLDCSHLPTPARTAIVGAVARLLYRRAVDADLARLPWLLVDEAHACYDGPARPALDALLTRGRHPGVSVALATQRPAALPTVAISQTDLLVAHRLTAAADVDALAETQTAALQTGFADRLPAGTGDALVVDDTTDSAVTVRVRERNTPHGGASPRASDLAAAADSRPDQSRKD